MFDRLVGLGNGIATRVKNPWLIMTSRASASLHTLHESPRLHPVFREVSRTRALFREVRELPRTRGRTDSREPRRATTRYWFHRAPQARRARAELRETILLAAEDMGTKTSDTTDLRHYSLIVNSLLHMAYNVQRKGLYHGTDERWLIRFWRGRREICGIVECYTQSR